MIPILSSNLALISKLSIVQSAIVWLHAAFGIAAIALGFGIIVTWISHPLGELGCSRAWRLMLPAFVIWIFALVLGLAIHIYNIV